MSYFNYGAVKRKVFVSYHHSGDQLWYDQFSRTFNDQYELLYDNSLDRRIDSDNMDYVYRQIRENYVVGSSVTVVLCGADTYKRKFVDWETYATLDCQHGLIGIPLPGLTVNWQQQLNLPARLRRNIETGYAVWMPRYPQSTGELQQAIETAVERSNYSFRIDNSFPMMPRNM